MINLCSILSLWTIIIAVDAIKYMIIFIRNLVKMICKFIHYNFNSKMIYNIKNILFYINFISLT